MRVITFVFVCAVPGLSVAGDLQDKSEQPATHETILKSPGFGWINHLCYSPDQKELCRVAAFGDVITDTASWKKYRMFNAGIRMLAYSPDGTAMATAEGNDGARIWNTADRGTPLKNTGPDEIAQLTKPAHVLLTPAQAHGQQRVLGAAYSPDGTRLLTTFFNGHVKIWKTDSGKEQADGALSTSPILCASFHPDGKRIAAGDMNGGFHLWDVELKKAISTKLTQLGGIASVSFSPDGAHLVTAHHPEQLKGSVMIWNTADWTSRTERGYRSAAFSKDGKTLAIAGGDIRLLALPTLEERGKITLSKLSLREAALRPINNDQIPDTKVTIWVQALAWAPDGRELAAGCFDGSVRLIRWGTE